MSKDGKQAPLDSTDLPELPRGWCWATVAELGCPGEQTVLTGPFGSTLGRKDFLESGVPLLTIGCLTEHGICLDNAFYISEGKASALKRYQVNPGDLLFSRSASVGRAGYVTGALAGSVINYHLMRLRLAPSAINPLLFIFYVRGSCVVVNYLREVNHGATRDGINTTDLLGMPVAIPPLSEQRRIVAKIEELFSDLDAGVAALQRVKAKLKRYRAAVLKAAVEGRLTEAWRAAHPATEPASQLLERILSERRRKWEADQLKAFAEVGKNPPANWKDKYQEPTGPDESTLPPLPEGWCWANLNQLKAFAMYGPRFSSDLYAEEGRLVLRTTDFDDTGRVNINTPPRMPLSDNLFSKYKVEPGDLLITRTGSLGTLAVYTDGEDAIAGAFLIHYRLAATSDTTWFVFYFLKSPCGRRSLVSGGAGIGRPNLNMPKIDGIPIPFPPLAEQRQILVEIERQLSVVQEAESQIDANLRRAARLRQSILKRAFEGRLVPQDPQDEPASVLLERIKTAAAASSTIPSNRKPAGERPRRSATAKTGKTEP